MKRIAILSAVNIKHMSLITLYTDILKEQGIEYDLIYMDKYDEDEYFDCKNKYRFVNKVEEKKSKLYKMVKYMMFLPFAKKIIKENKYDFIIVWNDVAIFMFANYLSKHQKNKYCLNVRDNMWYDKKIFKRRYQQVFKNSAFNTISSKGYLDFLPSDSEYIPVHSLNLSILSGMNKHNSLCPSSDPIKIGFIGSVRFMEKNKKLLDTFKNDKRFELHYYGVNANVLEEYASQNGILNTKFHDSFPVKDTAKYLERIDMINNLYGNETLNLQKAISIKFFHALYANIPILVCSNTFVGAEAKRIGIGFEVEEINDDMKNQLYSWYRKLDFDTISENSNAYIEQAIEENEKFKNIFIRMIG